MDKLNIEYIIEQCRATGINIEIYEINFDPKDLQIEIGYLNIKFWAKNNEIIGCHVGNSIVSKSKMLEFFNCAIRNEYQMNPHLWHI